jgi:hypothetical protein
MEEIQAKTDESNPAQGVPPSTIPAKGLEEQQIANRDGDEAAVKGPNAVYLAWQQISKVANNAWTFVKAPESTNVAIAVATIVIAVATVYTYLEIHGGSTQTDRIIAADERIAKAMEGTVGQAGKALDASINASRTDQRAWLGMEKIDVLFVVGQPLEFEASVRNSGKTPAVNVISTSVAEFIARNQEPHFSSPPEIPVGHGIEMPGHVFGVGFRIFTVNPGLPTILDEGRHAVVLTQPLRASIIDGTSRLSLHGRIDYRDIFGRPHWTRWCAFLEVDDNVVGGAATPLCTNHNTTDDNETPEGKVGH